MSRSSAYALADRDRVFAAGWDAAAYFARRPLADDLYEKGVDGIIETVRPSSPAVTRSAVRADRRAELVRISSSSGSDRRRAATRLRQVYRRCGAAQEFLRRGRRHVPDRRSRQDEPEGVNGISRVRHQHDIAGRCDSLRQIGKAFL